MQNKPKPKTPRKPKLLYHDEPPIGTIANMVGIGAIDTIKLGNRDAKI